jgi:hypothetical protein
MIDAVSAIAPARSWIAAATISPFERLNARRERIAIGVYGVGQ